ncbi:MAG: thioredoxin family protein [Gammaproteobacteria bacterium]
MTVLKQGDAAPAFTLLGIDDHHHSLAHHADKNAIVIIFNCNHCPFVRAWEDRMIQIQQDYRNRGVQLIAISANDAIHYPSDSFLNMKLRAKDKKFNFLYLHDATQQTARSYGAERTPEVFAFDKYQRLRYHGAIDDNYEDPGAVRKPYLRDALEAILTGQNPTVSETQPVGCTIKWK